MGLLDGVVVPTVLYGYVITICALWGESFTLVLPCLLTLCKCNVFTLCLYIHAHTHA